MSTKAVGSDARQDVTLDYKYPEKSAEERASHGTTAAKSGGDLAFELDINTNSKLGQAVESKLTIDPKGNVATVRYVPHSL